MITCVLATSLVPIDARVYDLQGCADKDVVDAQTSVSLPTLAAIVPERIRRTLAVNCLQRIRPTLGQDPLERVPRSGLQQGVVAPGVGLVDVSVGRHDVPVAQQDDGLT